MVQSPTATKNEKIKRGVFPHHCDIYRSLLFLSTIYSAYSALPFVLAGGIICQVPPFFLSLVFSFSCSRRIIPASLNNVNVSHRFEIFRG